MLNLSIMPMEMEHIDEICEDIKHQQDSGISDCGMLMMTFAPEGTPPVNKAENQCKTYDAFHQKLEKLGAKHGVLVQSTLGHVFPPSDEHPFQNVIGLVTGTKYDVCKPYDKFQLEGNVFKGQCCPYDKNLQKYLREQMHTLALRKPSVIMIDDDMGLVYRIGIKGCACPLHMAEFNRRAGTNMTREELVEHVFGDLPEDKRLTQIFLDVQGDSLVEVTKAMREGIDSVDPTIQGVVSSAGSYCEFTENMAEAFAGEGNPKIARFNNSCFHLETSRYFSNQMIRAAIQRENVKGKIDVFLTEGDTCPHNRYATSASKLHAHLTGTILEGAKGAKLWITPLSTGFDLSQGTAYRDILSKYKGFYDELSKLYDEFEPAGCRIPVSEERDYCLRVPNIFDIQLTSWGTKVLERYGVPMYVSKEVSGATFLDDNAADNFTDKEIKAFLGGTLFMSARAAKIINNRGFKEYTGVDVREWEGELISYERIKLTNTKVRRQIDGMEIIPLSDDVEVLSEALFISGDGNERPMYPASVMYKNNLGGTVVIFSGTTDTEFHYDKSVSFLNSSRKKQIVSLLIKTGNLPVYYPGDMEIYLKAGYLKDGSLMCGIFNISFDQLEEIPLVIDNPFSCIEILTPEGNRRKCDFYEKDGIVYVKEPAITLMPVILIIK